MCWGPDEGCLFWCSKVNIVIHPKVVYEPRTCCVPTTDARVIEGQVDKERQGLQVCYSRTSKTLVIATW